MEQFFKGISGHQRWLYLACTLLCMAIWHDGELNTEQWTFYNCRVVTTVFTVITISIPTIQPAWQVQWHERRKVEQHHCLEFSSFSPDIVYWIRLGAGAAAQQIPPLSLRSLVAIYIIRRRLRRVCNIRTIPFRAGKGENIYNTNNMIIFK